jgi:glycosyltransferase involved in cell wall biosynthesis
MRVLLVSQYFAPEMTAASARLTPLASGLAARGHEIEVIAELPNHPQGVVYEGFRDRPFLTRRGSGIQVRHVWTHATPGKGMKPRLLSYATYAASAAITGALTSRPDVVMASSPPLSVGAVGLTLARRHRVPLVFDVRDLWPEIAVSLGELTDPKVIARVERLEAYLYRQARTVTTPTEAFAGHITSIAGAGKAVVIPNGTTPAWVAAADHEVDRSTLDLPDGFLWTYAGNVGLSQDLGVAARAAEELGEEFTLLVLGAGSTRDQLEQLAQSLPNARILFRGQVEQSKAIEYARASDALLVPLADDAAAAKSVPIKLYDFCAVGRPVVVTAPGEAARIARENELALIVPPGDPSSLADAVRQLRDDSKLAGELSGRAKAWAAGQLRDAQVEPLERVLIEAAGG